MNPVFVGGATASTLEEAFELSLSAIAPKPNRKLPHFIQLIDGPEPGADINAFTTNWQSKLSPGEAVGWIVCTYPTGEHKYKILGKYEYI